MTKWPQNDLAKVGESFDKAHTGKQVRSIISHLSLKIVIFNPTRGYL